MRSVKEECLSKLILFGEKSLHRALAEFTALFILSETIKARAISYCSLFQRRGESVAVSTVANASVACCDITPVGLDFCPYGWRKATSSDRSVSSNDSLGLAA